MNRLLPSPAELAEAGGYLSRCKPYLARLQRERRTLYTRMDYIPGNDALAIIEAARSTMGDMSNSALLDAIVTEWAELTGTK